MTNMALKPVGTNTAEKLDYYLFFQLSFPLLSNQYLVVSLFCYCYFHI